MISNSRQRYQAYLFGRANALRSTSDVVDQLQTELDFARAHVDHLQSENEVLLQEMIRLKNEIARHEIELRRREIELRRHDLDIRFAAMPSPSSGIH